MKKILFFAIALLSHTYSYTMLNTASKTFDENTKIKDLVIKSYTEIINVYGTNSNIDWIRTEENYKDTIKQIEQATNNSIPASQKPIQFRYGTSIIVFKSN